MAYAIPIWDEILEPASWNQTKGTVAKLVGETGMGVQLTRLWDARKGWLDASDHLNPTAFRVFPDTAALKAQTDFEHEATETGKLARATETKFRDHKLIPKSSTENVARMAAAAEKLASTLRSNIESLTTLEHETRSFLPEPKKFIESHPCTLALLGQLDIPKVFGAPKARAEHVLDFVDKGSDTVSAILRWHKDRDGAFEILPVVSKASPRITFLPYEDSAITMTKVSSKAMWFFTGPLSGCNVYVATHAGSEPYVLHANLNNKDSNVKENVKAKDELAKKALAEIKKETKLDYAITRRLARGEYQGEAFVFGNRLSKGWEFWHHSIEDKGIKVVSKATAIPAV